ncbi:hypothetical protein NP233_g5362 [Leucocoprinus birnbaumii]|uniref:Uncharacterized protein n=1 Tax=Leucocoprinus birnbaumii TaxID=56174 RepID=A0AAD5VU84_9AGAR|nr:hypothetical protein NP233_g5362 [Leucocoprinus birnbaumii]
MNVQQRCEAGMPTHIQVLRRIRSVLPDSDWSSGDGAEITGANRIWMPRRLPNPQELGFPKTEATVMSRPVVSSPLAGNSSSAHTQTAGQRILPRRNPSFPSSRALRPFPSIAQSLQPSNTKKAVKIIEAPKNQKSMFMLDLTQAELSRQE